MNLERLQYLVLAPRHYWAIASLLARLVTQRWQMEREIFVNWRS
jgi:hypothetical protein